jgi:tRNA dimethylallyltransferase
MIPILIICGPTSTGKTKLAYEIANKFNGDLVSADSRQVYTGLDIASGKDLPIGATKSFSSLKFETQSIPYYSHGDIKLWGYDLAAPNELFSVSHYFHLANIIINHIYSRHKLPIIVGGTGFYLKALTNPPESLHIPPNNKLRQQLDLLTIDELQHYLHQLNPDKFTSMNSSDQQNPRRLIRAIEIASSKVPSRHFTQQYDPLWIGLTAQTNILDNKIEQRVKIRANNELSKEILNIEQKYQGQKLPSLTTLGYKQWGQYISNQIGKDEAINSWVKAEQQYVRRQITWFKKQSPITWFDISDESWEDMVVTYIQNWYIKKSRLYGSNTNYQQN